VQSFVGSILTVVPCKATIYNIVTKLRSTGSVLDKKKYRKRYILTEEKLDDIGARLEARRSRYVFWLFSVGWQKVHLTLVQSC
jgi:hypothetical protein